MFPAIELFLRSDEKSLEIFRSLSFDRHSHVTSTRRCFIDISYCYFCLNDPNDVCTRKYREIVWFIFEYTAVVWRPSYLAINRTRRVQRKFPSYVAYALKSSQLLAPIYLSYFWVYLPYLSVGPTSTLGGLLFSFKVPSHCTRTAQLLRTYSSFVHNHTRPTAQNTRNVVRPKRPCLHTSFYSLYYYSCYSFVLYLFNSITSLEISYCFYVCRYIPVE